MRCLFWVGVVLGCACAAAAEAEPGDSGIPPASTATGPVERAASKLDPRLGVPEPSARRWFFLAIMTNAYPRMETEGLIDYFDKGMRLVAPGFDDVKTVSDLRDNHMIWSPHFGIGLALNDHWTLFVEGGYAGGKVRTEANDLSIFLVPWHTDFEITRTATYASVGVDWSPWGQPQRRELNGLRERIGAARPFAGARAIFTYATYRAKVKFGFKPGKGIAVKIRDAWFIPGLNVVGGLDVPVSSESVLTVAAGYTFFSKRAHDFNSLDVTVAWKYYFR